MTYIWEDGPLFVQHLDGVKWYEAPVPPRKHTCWAQTKGVLPSGEEVERCACGAVRNPRWDSWLEKNDRASDEPEVDERLVWLQRIQYLCLGILLGLAFIVTFWVLAGIL